jgi:hypothetical protein
MRRVGHERPAVGPVGDAGPDDLGTLREAVRRLSEENDGLRRAIRGRAVIEQAKGVVMARLGVDPEAAWDHLRQVSRESNRKLADVAADELRRHGAGRVQAPATTVLPERRQVGPPTLEPVPRLPATLEGDRGLVLLSAAAQQASTLQELTQVLVDCCRWPTGPDRATVLSISADGSLALAAWVGISSETASRWQHVPMTVDFPATVAARLATPVFEDDPDLAVQRWPVLGRNVGAIGTFCNIPVVAAGVVVGVVGLGWPEGTVLDGRDRLLLRAAVAAVGDRFVALLPDGGVQSLLPAADGTPIERVAVTVALDAVSDECLVLLPAVADPTAPDEQPAAPDMVLAWGNTAARTSAVAASRLPGATSTVLGRRVSELAPHVVGGPLWRACLAAGDDRGTQVVTGSPWFWRPDDEPRDVSVTAMWNGVLLSRPAR